MVQFAEEDIQFYRNAIHSLPMSVAMLNDEGEIIETNENWDQFGEYNGLSDDYKNKGVNYLKVCESSSDDPYAERATKGLQEVLNGERSNFRMEYPCHADGMERWFIMQVRPFKNKDSDYYLVAHLDITSRKLSENKNQRLSSIVHNIPVCILTLNHVWSPDEDFEEESEFVISNINPHAEEVTGLRHQDVLGRSFEDVFGDLFSVDLRSKFLDVVRSNEIYEQVEIQSHSEEQPNRIWNLKAFNVSSDFLSIVFEEVTEEVENRERLEYLATHDELTGIFNRDHFMKRLGEEFDRSERYEGDFSFVLMDLDHFKAVNDNHGHVSGDRVLETIGEILTDRLRNSDLAGRYGGEEFGLILPETNLSSAKKMAERIRKDIAETKFKDKDGRDFQVTVSIGVAKKKQSDADVEDLLGRADKALYKAKEQGRDKVA